MKRYSILALLVCVFVSFASRPSHAQQATTSDIPRQISYQGVLTSSSGSVLPDGKYQLTITLYSDPGGTNSVWHDTYATTVSGGLFSLYLGSGTVPLPAPATMNKPLWVGVQVNGAEEMRPLTALSASPYSINVADSAITTGKIAAGAVTADKIGADYVSGIRINGEKVTGKGSELDIQGKGAVHLEYDRALGRLVIGSAQGSSEKGHQHNVFDFDTFGTPDSAWRFGGDLIDYFHNYVYTAADTQENWIGTSASSNNGYYPFNIRVYNEQIMHYQPNGTFTPNIVGGHKQNSIPDNAVGSIIAGGGYSGGNNVMTGGGDSVLYNTISGGAGNAIFGPYIIADNIGGGFSNTVYDSVLCSVISGGEGNKIHRGVTKGTIGGGHLNTLDSQSVEGTIAGGNGNTIYATAMRSTIGGGYQNRISSGSDNAVIAGGASDSINGDYSTVGGGGKNKVVASYGTIPGGWLNTIRGGDYNTIGGGDTNKIDTLARAGVIAGGSTNTIVSPDFSSTGSDWSTISGGFNSAIKGDNSTIGGGNRNRIDYDYSTIGGGDKDSIVGSYATISGGRQNKVFANYGTIGGGQGNRDSGAWSGIFTGDSNTVTVGAYNFIGGGHRNRITQSRAVVGGGEYNSVEGVAATIGGGLRDTARAVSSTIGGGSGNKIEGAAHEATIAGGNENIITDAAYASAIGGGYGDTVRSWYATISGGSGNNIFANADAATISGGLGQQVLSGGKYAAIVGGEDDSVQSYGQVAMGFWNKPRGSVGYRPLASGLTDDPLMMVGNGTPNDLDASKHRGNAFEVSYNGHSTVTGPNANAYSIKGATYTDNVIYAWGDVSADGIANCTLFGCTVKLMGPGWYRVTLDIHNPDGSIVALNCASITATISTGHEPQIPPQYDCKFITVTRVDASATGKVFDILITQPALIGAPGGAYYLGCQEVNAPFMFKVTGRPQQ
jgi:hypothetical protein